MNRKQLRERLKCTAGQLAAWIAGLPHARRGRVYVFDPAAVHDWLVAAGFARPRRIVHTEQAVADQFGKRSAGTIGHYKRRGMPYVGHPGNRPNDYDLDEIAKWMESEGLLGHTDEDRERAEIARIEKEIKQIKLDKLRGELVELEPVRRLVVRQIHLARTHLEQLPDRLVAALPASSPSKLAKRIRQHATDAIDVVCRSLAEQLADPDLTGVDRDAEAEFTERMMAAVDGVLNAE